MTEAEYADLTAACDELLSGSALTTERVAISWLHVLSEHPNNLEKYRYAFKAASVAAILKRTLWHALGVAESMFRALWQPEKGSIANLSTFPKEVDVLFISHLVSLSTTADSPDFYYGNLPEELEKRGESSLVALINHVPIKEKLLHYRLNRCGLASRVVLSRWSTLRQELHRWHRTRGAAAALRLEAIKAGKTPFQRRVALEAARYSTTRATITSLRLHDAVRELCNRFRPRIVVVTWEGHAWERLAFHAARCIDPNVRCIGYQHTVLLPRTHALKKSLGQNYDPDAILTVGEVNRNILASAPSLQSTPVMVYGSHRRRELSDITRCIGSSGRCIVIPEGLESECIILLNFVLSAAVRIPDLEFIIRMHPVIPFARFARRHPRFRKLPENVRLSDHGDIQEDFSRCDWAIYRGSSAAILAVLAGVRPVYVERPEELPLDPLFALSSWRQKISSVEDFSILVATDRATSIDYKCRQREVAKIFCTEYFCISNPDIVAGMWRSKLF
jgi:hypothetical protein